MEMVILFRVCSLHFVPGLQSAVHSLHFTLTVLIAQLVENSIKEVVPYLQVAVWCLERRNILFWIYFNHSVSFGIRILVEWIQSD